MTHTSGNGPAIVLVNPQMGENIGMCARAMLNCGLTDLRLVAPRDGWPSEIARATSSGAVDVIDGAKLYKTLAEAVADRTLVVATTARPRYMVKPILTPETAAQAIHLADQTAAQSTSAVLFGPERAGLSNDDLTHCDAILNIPLNPDYSSLNISQAVLLFSYEWNKLNSESKALSDNQLKVMDHLAVEDSEAASKEEVETLISHLTTGLDESGFFTTEAQRPTILRNLRNTFHRMRLSKQETHTFHGVIKALRGKEWKR
jgi:tRNA/rRNA methyltransferase